MQPQIQNTEFGFITVDGEEIDHDILIRLSGKVKKRKKKLSKEKGDSHTVSLAEAEHIFDEGAERLIIGSGQYGKRQALGGSRTLLQGKGMFRRIAPDARRNQGVERGRGQDHRHVPCDVLANVIPIGTG